MKMNLRWFVTVSLAVLAGGLLGHATCGGGGGGGSGGAVPSMGGPSSSPQVYMVSWVITDAGKSLPADVSLMVLWFPGTIDEVKNSDLRTSRVLVQAASRCVADVLVTADNQAILSKYKVTPGGSVAVLIDRDGAELGRALPKKAGGQVDARSIEKILQKEVDTREKGLTDLFKAADKKAKAGDKAAVDDLQKVWGQRCLVPSLGKKAAKSLEKLGVKVSQLDVDHLGVETLADADVFGRVEGVEPLLKQGLKAELAGDYLAAENLYQRATELDPADATPLRFLGELYRHQTGQWDKAGRVFNRILMQPADPIARAVALHALGKMTIHAGRFTAGLAMFEKSIATYPLPITYRNLAVYWFSEKQEEKAAGYMRQALALDPDDTYNQIFAAVYLAVAGHKDEAAKIARANEHVLEASYNLAAIWAQIGDRAKAMEMLKRQFYAYERFDAVRAMEMKEAREDYMLVTLQKDPEFVELTKLARNAYLIGAEWCSPDQLLKQPEAPIRPMSDSAPRG